MKFDLKHRKMGWLVAAMIGLCCINAVDAQVFDFVVAKDGSGTHTSIQSAINACPDNVRKTIFVKAGIYREKVYIGSHSVVSSKLISLIGEDANRVSIVWDDYNGKQIYYYNSASLTTSGTPQSATFTVNAVGFYAENISIINEYTAKQAVALYNVADKQTFKNVRLIGFQDTHYLKKGRRSYFLDSYIEGGTDYICAGGTAIFENCKLYSLKNGSYVTAPEDIPTTYVQGDTQKYYHGFVFRNCTLNSASNVEVYLGRPWQTTSSSVFINCKMENIRPEGWSEWSGTTNHLSSFFAENNSMDLNGNALNVSSRVSWSKQLTNAEVAMYYTNESVYSHLTAAYEPVAICEPLSAPSNLSGNSSGFSWDAVDGAIGYVVLRDGIVIGFASSANCVDNTSELAGNYEYSVRSVKQLGNLSAESTKLTVNYGPTSVKAPSTNFAGMEVSGKMVSTMMASNIFVYSLSGELLIKKGDVFTVDLSFLPKGIYVVKVESLTGLPDVKKVKL
jgi:pectinesterase